MMKPQQVIVLVVFLVSLSATLATSSGVCGSNFVWRNQNMSCPTTDTVCADVFNVVRDWFNGTRCNEQRVLHNCMCADNQFCPTDNPNHKYYETRTHTRYTCRSRCSAPWCTGRNRIRAMTTVRNFSEFGGRTFNKLECRCPRHHIPNMEQGMHRAVRTYSHRWDQSLEADVVIYECNNNEDVLNMADPCRH